MIFNGFYGLEVRFMQIRMDKENRELKAHGSYEFPVNISYEQPATSAAPFPGTGTRKLS